MGYDLDEGLNQPSEDIDLTINDDPIYFINGEEVSKKDVMLIAPENIVKVNVLKGKDAVKKYGDKGLNGVIELSTKQD